MLRDTNLMLDIPQNICLRLQTFKVMKKKTRKDEKLLYSRKDQTETGSVQTLNWILDKKQERTLSKKVIESK